MLVEPEELPEILDDFEIAPEEEKAIQHRDENLAKLRRRIEQYKVSRSLPLLRAFFFC